MQPTATGRSQRVEREGASCSGSVAGRRRRAGVDGPGDEWRMRGSVACAATIAGGCSGGQFEQILAHQNKKPDGMLSRPAFASSSRLPQTASGFIRSRVYLVFTRKVRMCPEGVDHLLGDGVVTYDFKPRPGLRLKEGGNAAARPPPVSVGKKDACRSDVNQLLGVAAKAPAIAALALAASVASAAEKWPATPARSAAG